MSLLAPIICDNGTGYSKVGYVSTVMLYTAFQLTKRVQFRRELRSLVVSFLPSKHDFVSGLTSPVVCSLLRLPLEDQQHKHPALAPQSLQSPGISPRSAVLRISISLSAMKLSRMRKPQATE